MSSHMSPRTSMSMHVGMCPTMCHHYNLYTCMAAMCHAHVTSLSNNYAWMTRVMSRVTTKGYLHAWLTCVSPHVTTKGHAHAWLSCVFHMTPLEAMAMHRCHVCLHMSPLETIAMHGCHVSSQMAPPTNQVDHLLPLVMTLNEMSITHSFHVCFGCSRARWKAYQQHNCSKNQCFEK